MGCACSSETLQSRPKSIWHVPKGLTKEIKEYSPEAFIICVERALRVPSADGRDLASLDLSYTSNPYIRIRCQNKTWGRTKGSQEKVNPVWNQVIDLTGVQLDSDIDFDLWDRPRTSFNDRLGFSRISVRDLVKRPQITILVLKPGGSGDFLVKDQLLPTELQITVLKVPHSWPLPQERTVTPHSFAKHVMILTRGTRGDVQPYCALARGLAEQMNWMVTLCTELRYKDFVLSMAKGLTRGCIRYRPSGGDTHSRIDKPIAKWAMKHQSELMQLAMLARSEREFFASEPIMYYWCEKLQPDCLIYGFTMVNVALILSEKFNIPCAGFVLQPTSLPSKSYPPVASIDTHLIGFMDLLEKKASNHAFLQTFKMWMEDDPVWKPLSSMRVRRGLRPFRGKKSETFDVLYKNQSPIVIPINEVAFGGRPPDWPSCIELTDFIFLQGDSVVARLSAQLESFIENARLAGEPVVGMTFSSMPVSRGDIVQSSLRIVKECKSTPRVIALSGAKVRDLLSPKLARELNEQVKLGKIIELEGAPFGLLFSKLDAVCVHGGLGTTAEAMRAGIPTTVVGVLLMDQRFWGMQCEQLNIGTSMVHIANWKKKCVSTVDAMLLGKEYQMAAQKLAEQMLPKPPLDGGVTQNVQAIVRALTEAKPIFTGHVRINSGGEASSQAVYSSSGEVVESVTEADYILRYAVNQHGSNDCEDSNHSPNEEDLVQKTRRKTMMNRISRAINVEVLQEQFKLAEEVQPTDMPGDDKDEFVD